MTVETAVANDPGAGKTKTAAGETLVRIEDLKMHLILFWEN